MNPTSAVQSVKDNKAKLLSECGTTRTVYEYGDYVVKVCEIGCDLDYNELEFSVWDKVKSCLAEYFVPCYLYEKGEDVSYLVMPKVNEYNYKSNTLPPLEKLTETLEQQFKELGLDLQVCDLHYGNISEDCVILDYADFHKYGRHGN